MRISGTEPSSVILAKQSSSKVIYLGMPVYVFIRLISVARWNKTTYISCGSFSSAVLNIALPVTIIHQVDFAQGI